ncbi:hypothetical protein Tco_1194350 [Tanacetum coccineum]
MGDTISQTRFESVSKHSNDLLLARGNTLQSDEDRLKLDELMTLCTTLQNQVLDLEKTKTTQHNEIASLKRRVKKLEKKNSLGEDASKQGRIDAIDADEEITLVSVQNVDKEMFDVNVLDGEEVFVAEQEVAGNKENDEVNVVEEVVEVINTTKLIINDAQVSVAGNVVSNASAATTVSAATITSDDDGDITLAQALIEIKSIKPKNKGVVIQELEPVKPMKKKDLIRLDEETALKLQAKFDEEERLAREKAEKEEEANIALIETWDDIQAKINKIRKHFAAKRAEVKKKQTTNKSSTEKDKVYLPKEHGRIQAQRFKVERLVEGKEKRAGTKQIQENTKKQKVDDDKETTELKQCLKIIPDEEEVTIDAIPLAVKSPSIIGWKIYKKGRQSYYQLMRADGSLKFNKTSGRLGFVIMGDLKTMFEPHVEDKVWRNQQDYKVLNWKLYDSCGVLSLMMQHVHIIILVEKKYPLTPLTLSMMLEKKLMIDYESEMAYQLLKFIIK